MKGRRPARPGAFGNIRGECRPAPLHLADSLCPGIAHVGFRPSTRNACGHTPGPIARSVPPALQFPALSVSVSCPSVLRSIRRCKRASVFGENRSAATSSTIFTGASHHHHSGILHFFPLYDALSCMQRKENNEEQSGLFISAGFQSRFVLASETLPPFPRWPTTGPFADVLVRPVESSSSTSHAFRCSAAASDSQHLTHAHLLDAADSRHLPPYWDSHGVVQLSPARPAAEMIETAKISNTQF